MIFLLSEEEEEEVVDELEEERFLSWKEGTVMEENTQIPCTRKGSAVGSPLSNTVTKL